MPRITPTHWRIQECIFTKDGFVFERQKGDHKVYSRKGTKRPVVIPMYNEVCLDIIQSNMRTANMTRDKYFEYLNEC